MPDGASPEPEEGAEIVDALFHPNPVSIPVGALRTLPIRRPAFGPTFMIGACSALWLSAAVVTGEWVPIFFAGGWIVVLALDIRIALRKS